MDIIFLGYSLINFTNDDGQHIDGLKFYFAHESDKSNYLGCKIAFIRVLPLKLGIRSRMYLLRGIHF